MGNTLWVLRLSEIGADLVFATLRVASGVIDFCVVGHGCDATVVSNGEQRENKRRREMTRNKKSGFTLVELMVVAVIVAILAAVAIPLMTGNRTRAMATEAEAALGTMRTTLRAMFAQTGAYNVDLDGNAFAAGAATTIPGIDAGNLDGRFFDDDAYSITAIGASTYTLRALGSASGATRAADVSAITITMDQDGTITRTGL